MPAYIHRIETVVPEHAYTQDYALEKMAAWMGDPKAKRVLKRMYAQSGIEKRHSVLKDFALDGQADLFKLGPDGRLSEPSTGERNRCFIQASRRLSVDAARKVVAAAAWIDASQITHVVTVSCTGFYNPGPDFDIVTGLGLSDATERYHIGFMGCYAAFPALRMAKQFCEANSGAVVLVVCLELCTLHLNVRKDLNSMLANALFSDGAAAVLVSGRPPPANQPALALDHFGTALAVEGERDMAWEIGDRGFDIVLSSYIPDIIAANIRKVVESVLADSGADLSEIDVWAIHPGGNAILAKAQSELELGADALSASREVLRDYGNMSSATVLFVLKKVLEDSRHADGSRICAMAFGPGLTIESAVMSLVTARPLSHQAAEAAATFTAS